MPDLSKLTDTELEALERGDLSKLSDASLQHLASEMEGSSQSRSVTSPGGYTGKRFDLAPIQGKSLDKEFATNAVRYGVPLAAGLATGGIGFLPAMTVGMGAGVAGEMGAEAIEMGTGQRESYSGGKILGSGIINAAVPAPLRQGGSTVANFIANSAIGLGASEGARYVEQGEFNAPKGVREMAERIALPVITGGLGTVANRVKNITEAGEKKVAQIRAERMGAPPLIHEIDEAFTGVEAKALATRNEHAVKLAQDGQLPIAEAISVAYADAPNGSEIAKKIIPYAEKNLEELRLKYLMASNEARAAEERVAAASGSGGAAFLKAKQEARDAAVEAVAKHALYKDGLESMFKGSLGSVQDFAPGARIMEVQKLSNAARDASKAQVTALYNQAGITSDTPVASWSGIISAIDNNKELGAFSKEAVKEKIINFVTERGEKGQRMFKPGSVVDGTEDLTHDTMSQLKSLLAGELAGPGEVVKLDNRTAAAAYKSVAGHSDAYLKSRLPSESYDALVRGRDSVSAISKARDGVAGVIDDLSAGNIDRVVSRLEKQGGSGPVWKEIEQYASALAAPGTPEAGAVSSRFMDEVKLAIRDHLVDTSLIKGAGVDNGNGIIDMKKLVKRVDTLRQNGVAPETIGLGDSNTVAALARISNASGRMSQETLGRFLRDVQDVGVAAAEARKVYLDAQRSFLMASNKTEQQNALNVMRQKAVAAKLDEAAANKLYSEAAADPLVRLLNEKGHSFNPNNAANANYVSRIMESSPTDIERFMSTLAKRNPGAAEDLKKAAASELIFGAFHDAAFKGDKRVNITTLANTFYGPSGERNRNSLRAIMGGPEYFNLEESIIKPLSDIARGQSKLENTTQGSMRNSLAVLFGSLSAGKGNLSGGYVASNYLERIGLFIANKQYNLLYSMLIDPNWVPLWKKAGYSVDKFVNANPRNMVEYKLIQQLDSKRDEEK